LRGGIEPQYVKRFARGLRIDQAEPPTLADGKADDAVMPAEHATVTVHDVARFDRTRAQPRHHVDVAALRDEADILAVGLAGDVQAEPCRVRARLALLERSERKAQEVELRLRGGKQEIALVAR